MSKLMQPQFEIGHTVYALSHHRDWGTPQLTLATVSGVVWGPVSIGYRFLPELDDRQDLDLLFDSESEEEMAATAFHKACERHQSSHARERTK